MNPTAQQNFEFHQLKSSNLEENEETRVQGRWNHQEHLRFLNAIITNGKDWKRVQDEVESRTGAQVRSHAQKYFLKITKIIKDRRKIKGKKIPEVTQTEKQLKQYFALNPLSPSTPKQIIELLKIQKMGIKQSLVKNCNEFEKLRIAQLLVPSPRIDKRKVSKAIWTKVRQNSPNIIKQQTIKNADQSSFLTSFMRNHIDYFTNGGKISDFIDYGMGQKPDRMQNEQPQTRGSRRGSFYLINQVQQQHIQ